MNSNPTNKNSRESYSKKDVENRITDPTTLSVDEQIDEILDTYSEIEIYRQQKRKNHISMEDWIALRDGITAKTKDSLKSLIRQVCEEVIKEITINQNGMFDDDAGNACWYVDDLDMVLRTKLNKIIGSDK